MPKRMKGEAISRRIAVQRQSREKPLSAWVSSG